MNRHSFSIYNASAGSGKTFTLVKEYLAIILTAQKNDAYRNILAITFTNKAVGEMKKRIVDSLHAFAKEDTDNKTLDLLEALEIETGLSAAKIRSKSKSILKNILHNYASFDISTIDKFTHRILRSFSFDLELPALFEVSLDTDDLLTEAVDAIIAKAGEDDNLTKLLLDFTLEKTDNDKSWDISREIFDMSKLLVNENDRKEVTNYKEKSITEFLTIKKQLGNTTKKIEEDCAEIAKQSLQLIADNGIENSSFNRGLIPNNFIKIAAGNVIKYDKIDYLEEGKRYAKSKPQGQKSAIDAIANQLLDNLLAINLLAEKYYLYQAFLKNIIPLSLLNTVGNALETIQKEKNIISISEFNAIINKEIQNQPAPFIYERLGERYRHFFIDEFQDTSEMQWQNLIPLIDNAIVSEDHSGVKGSLLLVGDPKQSIYRWRGGKAEQFIALTKNENPFNTTDKEVESLKTNYRSFSQVIEFNNSFFKFIANQFTNPDYMDLYANNSWQECNNKKGGYVAIELIDAPKKDDSDDSPDKTELYLQAILKTINQALANGFTYSDMVILTRKNSNGVAIANFLTEEGIPILSSDTLLMHLSSEIKLLLNVLKYSNNTKNKMAKAAFLQYVAENKQDTLDTHEFIKQGIQLTNELDFEQWLATFGIAVSFTSLRQKSIYETVETCIRTFIPFDKNHAYVHYFSDIVLEFDIRKQASLSDFFDYWEKKEDDFKIPSPEGNQAVKIMSIHKSKGLEFPVVILPFVEDMIGSLRNKMWLAPTEDFYGLAKVLVNKTQEVANYGDSAATEYTIKSQEELLDTINILYVALTRAEEQLHIISSLKKNKDGVISLSNTSGFLGLFLDNQNLYKSDTYFYEWGNPKRISTPHTTDSNANTTITPVVHLFDTKNIKIAQREALLWDSKQAEAIEYGNLLHQIIALVYTEKDIVLSVENALSNGLITKDSEKIITQKLLEIVSHPELQFYFNEANNNLNEQAILVKGGKTVKPDKMVLLPNKTALLLDYKTGAPEKKHILQINDYAYVLQNMGYAVTQKVLVYIKSSIEVMVV